MKLPGTGRPAMAAIWAAMAAIVSVSPPRETAVAITDSRGSVAVVAATNRAIGTASTTWPEHPKRWAASPGREDRRPGACRRLRVRRGRAGRRHDADASPPSAGSTTATTSRPQLEALGYKVDLQYAKNDIPTQVKQIENQITKGAKLLIIASIDGTALTTQLQKRQGQRTSRSSPTTGCCCNTPNVDYYATFDNYKVGVAAGDLAADRAQAAQRRTAPKGTRQGPVQRRAVRRLAGRQQRDVLLQRRDDACSSRTSTTARWWSRAGRPTSRRSRSCAGTRPPRRSAWRTCSPRPTAAAPRSTGVLSPYDGLSIGILSALKSNGYGTAAPALPDRHRAGRRARLGQVDHRGRAVLDRLQGHPPAGRRPPWRWPTPCSRARSREVNNTTDYNNGIKVVPSMPAAAGGRRQGRTTRRSSSTPATTPRPSCS